MKDWIDERRPPEDLDLSYPWPRELVQGAWDSITPQQIHTELSRMPAKCHAVLKTNGGHINKLLNSFNI
jgi:hypothetical protein